MKAKILNYYFEPSETVEKQGNRSSIDPYLKRGYYINKGRNGYWVLVKPARVLVTIGDSKVSKTFNMKDDIRTYYGKSRISTKMVERFVEDVEKNKIKITLNLEEDSYSIE